MPALKAPPGVNGRVQDCFGRRWRRREQTVHDAYGAIRLILGTPRSTTPAGHFWPDGSGPHETTSVEWVNIPTRYGMLDYIHLSDSGFMCRFADTTGPLPFGASRPSGKWNLHFFDNDPAAIIAQFVARLADVGVTEKELT